MEKYGNKISNKNEIQFSELPSKKNTASYVM